MILGTGKTITVVEAILQVLTKLPGSRLIACTPSNSAADLLAERLHRSGALKMSDMVRLNAFNRSIEVRKSNFIFLCIDQLIINCFWFQSCNVISIR